MALSFSRFPIMEFYTAIRALSFRLLALRRVISVTPYAAALLFLIGLACKASAEYPCSLDSFVVAMELARNWQFSSTLKIFGTFQGSERQQ